MPKPTDSKWLLDFSLNSLCGFAFVSRSQLFENCFKIVSCSKVFVAFLCEKSVFFCLTNSCNVYSSSIDAFDHPMSTVDSTQDFMYHGVMFMLYAAILLVLSNPRCVTQPKICVQHIIQLSNSNHGVTSCLLSQFMAMGQVLFAIVYLVIVSITIDSIYFIHKILYDINNHNQGYCTWTFFVFTKFVIYTKCGMFMNVFFIECFVITLHLSFYFDFSVIYKAALYENS